MGFRKTLQVLVITSILIILFAGSAYGSEFEVKYVYYENADLDIVRVDYAEAVDAKRGLIFNDEGVLYDATVEAVRDALGDFREVWVAVIVAGEPDLVYIDYSVSLQEGLTLAEAVDNPGEDYYNVGDENEPDYQYELVVQDGTAIEKSVEYDWLEEDGVIQVWDKLGEQWIVYVILTDDLPDDADIGNVESVLVKGKVASQDPSDDYRWRLSFADSDWWEEDTFVVTAEDIVLVINGEEYSM